MSDIQVTLADGRAITCADGTEVGSLAGRMRSPDDLPFIAALVNNDVASLSYPLTVDSDVRFLTMADAHGARVYCRSLCFLLAKAVHDLFPAASFSVEHSLGTGLYFTFSSDPGGRRGIREEELAAIDGRLRELIDRNVPIARRKISFTAAVRQFEQAGQVHKLHLLKYRNPPRVVIYECEGFFDLAHGPLATRAGTLDRFQLIHYPPGFVLLLPDLATPR